MQAVDFRPVCSACRCPCRAETDQGIHQCLCLFHRCSHYRPSLHYTEKRRTEYHTWLLSPVRKCCSADGCETEIAVKCKSDHLYYRTRNFPVPLNDTVGIRVTGIKAEGSTGLSRKTASGLIPYIPNFTLTTLKRTLTEWESERDRMKGRYMKIENQSYIRHFLFAKKVCFIYIV